VSVAGTSGQLRVQKQIPSGSTRYETLGFGAGKSSLAFASALELERMEPGLEHEATIIFGAKANANPRSFDPSINSLRRPGGMWAYPTRPPYRLGNRAGSGTHTCSSPRQAPRSRDVTQPMASWHPSLASGGIGAHMPVMQPRRHRSPSACAPAPSDRPAL
jgi:hypothetical protein